MAVQCRSLAESLTNFLGAVRKAVIDCIEELKRHLYPFMENTLTDIMLDFLERENEEERPKQFAIVRRYLDEIHTLATEQQLHIERCRRELRSGAGKIRNDLRKAEEIANDVGMMKADATKAAFRAANSLC